MAKLEFLSIGGSVKDRIAKAMVLSAEKEGRLIPGKSVVIEASSGNTGQFPSCVLHVVPSQTSAWNRYRPRLGMCNQGILPTAFALEWLLNTVDKGYSVIITMPNKMSLEKESLLRALGARVVRTPNEEPFDSPNGLFGRSPIVYLSTLVAEFL